MTDDIQISDLPYPDKLGDLLRRVLPPLTPEEQAAYDKEFDAEFPEDDSYNTGTLDD